jgi:hypothetical protein
MPFEITWEPRGVYKKVWGEVTAQEFMQSIAAQQNDPRFDSLKYAINDFLGVEKIHITESDVHMFAATAIGASYSNPKLKIVIAATHPGVLALVREYAKVVPYPLEFVTSLEEARNCIPVRYRT